MSVSKQDWKQWHDSHWDNCNQLTIAMTQAFEETIAAVTSGDADRFLSLSGGDTAEGLHQTTNTATHAISSAAEDIEKLGLKGNQRRFANQDAIEASDGAINGMSQLHRVVDQIDTDLVRGLVPDRETVKGNPAELMNIASNLNDRLNSSLYTVQQSLARAEATVQQLAGISKIGRF